MLEPAYAGDVTATQTKLTKKQVSIHDTAVDDPDLARRCRVAVMGIKRSLLCGTITLAVLIVLYFFFR